MHLDSHEGWDGTDQFISKGNKAKVNLWQRMWGWYQKLEENFDLVKKNIQKGLQLDQRIPNFLGVYELKKMMTTQNLQSFSINSTRNYTIVWGETWAWFDSHKFISDWKLGNNSSKVSSTKNNKTKKKKKDREVIIVRINSFIDQQLAQLLYCLCAI